MANVRDKIEQSRVDANRGGNVRSAPTSQSDSAAAARAAIAARVAQKQAAATSHVNLRAGLPISTTLYHKTSLLVALVVAEFIWIALYLLNAFSTAWGSQPPIRGFFSGLNRLIVLVDPEAIIVLDPIVPWVIGFAFAILSTFIELHLWRSGSRRLFYFLGVPIMFWDHYTASQMVNMFFNGNLADPLFWHNFWSTVGGDIIALVPEPMLVVTTATLIAVLRARGVRR